MRPPQKGKKRWVWFLGIATMLIMMFLYGQITTFIIPSYSVATYTKAELAVLYQENKDELKRVAEIVLANNAVRQRIIDDNDDDWGIFTQSDKDYFSEEDWNEIVKLFKKIRPNMIMRSLRHGDTVYFDFGTRKTDGLEIDTSLYYFRSAETMEHYTDYSWVGVLEQLDGYWYIGEHVRQR